MADIFQEKVSNLDAALQQFITKALRNPEAKQQLLTAFNTNEQNLISQFDTGNLLNQARAGGNVSQAYQGYLDTLNKALTAVPSFQGEIKSQFASIFTPLTETPTTQPVAMTQEEVMNQQRATLGLQPATIVGGKAVDQTLKVAATPTVQPKTNAQGQVWNEMYQKWTTPSGPAVTTPTTQPTNQWTQQLADQYYQKYLSAGYTESEASSRISQLSGLTPQTGQNLRKLGSTEFSGLQAQWKKEGLTQQEIEQNFLSRSGADIYLKTTAPSSQQIIANREIKGVGVSDIGIDTMGIGTGDDFNAPATTANQTITNYVTGVAADVQNTRTILENTYQKQLDSAKADSKKYLDEIDLIMKEKGDTLEDIDTVLQPWREKLETTERERLKIEENYFANQKTVEELETLLTQVMSDVQAMKSQTGLSSILSPRIQKAVDDANARIGVLQAVMAARNDQITVAENLIDRSMNAITADKQDRLTYYNAVLSFYDEQKADVKELLNISLGEQRTVIEAQVTLLENDLANAEATATVVKNLMLDPDNVVMIQKAGISLNDTVEQISAKMADWQAKQPAEVDTQIVTAGGRQLLIDKNTGETIKDLGRAYKEGDGTTPTFKFSTANENVLLGAGFTTTDIDNIQTNIQNGNSIDDIIAAVPDMTENQENVLRSVFTGIEPTEELDETTVSLIIQGAVDDEGNLDITKIPADQRIEVIDRAQELGFFEETEETKGIIQKIKEASKKTFKFLFGFGK